jgi:hypothetical protein
MEAEPVHSPKYEPFRVELINLQIASSDMRLIDKIAYCLIPVFALAYFSQFLFFEFAIYFYVAIAAFFTILFSISVAYQNKYKNIVKRVILKIDYDDKPIVKIYKPYVKDVETFEIEDVKSIKAKLVDLQNVAGDYTDEHPIRYDVTFKMDGGYIAKLQIAKPDFEELLQWANWVQVEIDREEYDDRGDLFS